MASTEMTGTAGRSSVKIGRYTYGHERTTVKQWGEGAALRIGSFCSLAENITIYLGGNHRLDWITTYPFGHIAQDAFGPVTVPGHPATRGDVVIGDDVWIGAGATIMSGVTIGTGAVVAANAHVVKSIEPYAIVGGNPAVLIRWRFESEIIGLLLQLSWWELPEPAIRQLIPHLCHAPDATVLRQLVARYRPEMAAQ